MQNVLFSVKKHLASPIIQLALVVLASLLVYIFAFFLPINLFKLYDHPRLDAKLLFYQGRPAYVRLSLTFIAVWVLYLIGYRISMKVSADQKRSAWLIILSGMVLFILVFLFVAPFDAADIYDNIMHGRILGIYHANPFKQVVANYPNDPFYEYAAWKQAISAYGPFWESLAALTAQLVGDGIVANVMAFKILPGVFHLAGVALVAMLLKRKTPEQSLSGVLLLGWNPMMLYETWGNGHNDVAMAFWFLLATWWILQRRYTFATLSLLAGALMKYIPILLVPAVLLIAWRNLGSIGARMRYLTRTGVLVFTITFAAYYPFWNRLDAFSIGRRMNMFTTSIPAVAYRLLNLVLRMDKSAQWVSLTALTILVIFVIIQSFHLSNPSQDFSTTTFNILAFYLMVTCLWFQQWYSIWLVCLAPLVSPRSRSLALVLSFWVVSRQLVFGPLYIPTMYWHPETYARLQPLLASTVLGIPWLYAVFILIRGKKQHAAT